MYFILIAAVLGGLYAWGAIMAERLIGPGKLRWSFIASTAIVTLVATCRWNSESPGTYPVPISRLMAWVGHVSTYSAVFLIPALVVLTVTAALQRTRISLFNRWFIGMLVTAVSFLFGALLVIYLSTMIFHENI